MLHSEVSSEEQQRAFIRMGRNQRKIILATNIAESSITVPDIGFGKNIIWLKCIIGAGYVGEGSMIFGISIS